MGTYEVIKDSFILALAVISLLTSLMLLLLVTRILSLVSMIRRDVKPIIQSLTETAATIKGTTAFASEVAIKPSMKYVGMAAVAGRLFRMFGGKDEKKKRKRK